MSAKYPSVNIETLRIRVNSVATLNAALEEWPKFFMNRGLDNGLLFEIQNRISSIFTDAYACGVTNQVVRVIATAVVTEHDRTFSRSLLPNRSGVSVVITDVNGKKIRDLSDILSRRHL